MPSDLRLAGTQYCSVSDSLLGGQVAVVVCGRLLVLVRDFRRVNVALEFDQSPPERLLFTNVGRI